MKNDNKLALTEDRISALGLYLAEFALDFVSDDEDLSIYTASHFLALFDKWYDNFIRHAETNRMFYAGEKEALIENNDDLVSCIKEAAIDAARELILEKI
ncbi:MAG: hypothetical protein JW973_18480 [Bacteroidales bacterium]|nr:hypothetical protein [Bacteroidales bacterium]